MLYCVPMASTDITALTPVEIDTELSRIYQDEVSTWSRIAYYADLIDRTRRSKYGTLAEIDKHTAVLDELRAHNRALIVEKAPYEVEFNRRGGWHRYFLVKNANGHVHRGLNCSTCFPDTQYGWLVNLADCDEDAMIEEWGERACTVCFPNAPVNPNYFRKARIDREAQEARDIELRAKLAAKAEKAITDVDGSPLRVDNDTLRTKVAARNALSSAFQSLVYYGTDHPSDFVTQIRRLAAALEAAGVDWKKVPDNAIKRAVKDSVVPPNNPFRLTPEQIASHEAEIKVNAAQAQALAQEVIG
jgi:hypothetical protein